MREQVEAFITSRRFEVAITVLIILNAITLGLETSEAVMDRFGPVLLFFDRAVLWVFVVELALRFYVYRTKFFHDPWRIFDFVIVGIALMPTTGSLSVLRALRILRVLRLVSMVPSLRRVVGGLIAALPGMGSITVLLTLIFYVFSVIATKLYGTGQGACEAVEGRCAQLVEWFGTLPASAYSLFQIMTLESWSMGIVRPVMEVSPLCLDVLHPVHSLHDLHGAQPFHRHHRFGHASRARGDRRTGARRFARRAEGDFDRAARAAVGRG
jgi:voltage-gated sodium channel